jgi:hypothetical protein
MRLTIIPIDKKVGIDELFFDDLDFSICNIPSNVHALQWYETKGWIEFDDPIDPFAPKPPNEEITVLPEWAITAMAKWDDAKVAEEIAQAQAQLDAIKGTE